MGWAWLVVSASSGLDLKLVSNKDTLESPLTFLSVHYCCFQGFPGSQAGTSHLSGQATGPQCFSFLWGAGFSTGYQNSCARNSYLELICILLVTGYPYSWHPNLHVLYQPFSCPLAAIRTQRFEIMRPATCLRSASSLTMCLARCCSS